jgi:hypothetical protein
LIRRNAYQRVVVRSAHESPPFPLGSAPSGTDLARIWHGFGTPRGCMLRSLSSPCRPDPAIDLIRTGKSTVSWETGCRVVRMGSHPGGVYDIKSIRIESAAGTARWFVRWDRRGDNRFGPTVHAIGGLRRHLHEPGWLALVPQLPRSLLLRFEFRPPLWSLSGRRRAHRNRQLSILPLVQSRRVVRGIYRNAARVALV